MGGVPNVARKAQVDDTDLINSVIKGVTASRDIAPSPALKEACPERIDSQNTSKGDAN